jgi:hypothetical protein
MQDEARDAELRAIARDATRARKFPPDARCGRCGRQEDLLLRSDNRILCYECQLAERGKAITEADHVAGRANSPLTIAVRASAHRSITEFRSRNGIDDWPNAEGNPLLTAAHFAAGLAAHLVTIARWIKDLAIWLDQRLGPTWWEGGPPCPVAP